MELTTIQAEPSFKSSLIDLIAGSLGGVAVVYVGQPLDTVKVKMQSFPHIYKGMYDCIKRTLKSDGLRRGLYAGTSPAIVANVAENSILFAGYGFCQKIMAKLTGVERVEDMSAVSHATAGSMAAFLASFTLCPTELVKCQLQAMREVKRPTGQTVQITPFQLTKDILRQHGLPGMYRGLTSTFMREMPGYFFFFGAYEGSRVLLAKPGQSKDDIGLLRTMLAGAVGGIVLWTVIFPADVIKSRIQVSGLTKSFLSVGCVIWKEEGFLALYNGLKPTLVRTIPATAALFVVVEYSRKYMNYVFGE